MTDHTLIGIARLERQVKAYELLVVFHKSERFGPRAHLIRDPVDLIVKHIT
jgi:hypothetical protein